MTITRDQLRAARILLRIEQRDLHEMSKVGLATIRRFEGGQTVRPALLVALQHHLERAGAIFLTGSGTKLDRMLGLGLGVALAPRDQLPEETVRRIEAPPVKRTRKTRQKVAAALAEAQAETPVDAQDGENRKGGPAAPFAAGDDAGKPRARRTARKITPKDSGT